MDSFGRASNLVTAIRDGIRRTFWDGFFKQDFQDCQFDHQINCIKESLFYKRMKSKISPIKTNFNYAEFPMKALSAKVLFKVDKPLQQ